LSYSAINLPDGLTINPSTGLISGTVAPGAASLPTAHSPLLTVITASNGTDSDTQMFRWSVASPVQVTNPGAQSAVQGNTVSLQIQASDVNNHRLVYQAFGLPTGLSINHATRLITNVHQPVASGQYER